MNKCIQADSFPQNISMAFFKFSLQWHETIPKKIGTGLVKSISTNDP
jgi:hypothetical protein